MWDSDSQRRLTAAYYWGFVSSQAIGGRLTGVIGGKMLLFVALVISSILTILTPALTLAGQNWILAIRVIIGLAQVRIIIFFLCYFITVYYII